MRHVVLFYKKYFKGRCLDLGCKDGSCLRLMPEGSFGIDIEPTCKVKGRTIIQKDLNSGMLPFENEYFDFVLASHIIEHLDSPSNMLKEIYRVLKTGGKCIVAVPLFVFWNRSNYKQVKRGHLYFFNTAIILHMLKMHNFRILRVWHNFLFGGRLMYYLWHCTPLCLLSKDIHVLCEKRR